eukprot:tig00021428_g21157.t2
MILAVARSGLVPASIIAEASDIRCCVAASVKFYSAEASGATLTEPVVLFWPEEALRGKRVLVVDDVWDSGETMRLVRSRALASGAAQVTTCTVYFKPEMNKYPGDGPNAHGGETDSWIVFPWKPLALRSKIHCV